MNAIFSKFRNWANRHRDADFLSSQMSSGIGDLAIPREDARRLLDSRPDVRERMLAMAAMHGLSARDIDQDRATALDVALSCGDCANESLCMRFLEGSQKADPADFCPNNQTYREMASHKA